MMYCGDAGVVLPFWAFSYYRKTSGLVGVIRARVEFNAGITASFFPYYCSYSNDGLSIIGDIGIRSAVVIDNFTLIVNELSVEMAVFEICRSLELFYVTNQSACIKIVPL